MLTRRKLLKNSGIAALAAASSNLLLRAAHSQSASTFDYYISPTGDDNNAGTLASPWSITALNSKMTVYSGKRIGIIGDVGGVQTPIQYGTVGGAKTTLYSMMQTINSHGQLAAIKINGGTSSASTYLGSCTSAGGYKVGWAIVDAANPAGGAPPVGAQAIIMGQPFYGTSAVPNPGYTTLDGLVVRNFNYAGIIFGDVQTATLYGVIIQNCQIYNGICSTSSENPGGVFLGTTNGAQVLNCLIKDCNNTSGFVPGTGGITTYKALGLIVKNCTITGCGYAVQNKDSNQYGTYSYNYFDTGTFGASTGAADACCIKSCIPGKGETLICHHNIMVGIGYWGYGADALNIDGAVTFYNNTFYTPPSLNAAWAVWLKCNSDAGPFIWYNNLIYYSAYMNNQGGPTGTIGFEPIVGVTGANWDYNYYGAGINFGTSTSGTLSLANWQAMGYDVHTKSGGSPFSATPAALNINSFQISGPATTAGRNGSPCGALDGSGTIGCNFAAIPTPRAPLLNSVS